MFTDDKTHRMIKKWAKSVFAGWNADFFMKKLSSFFCANAESFLRGEVALQGNQQKVHNDYKKYNACAKKA